MTTDYIRALRRQFPALSQRVYGNPLIYLDNAATTQKPRDVINATTEYYKKYNANVHRSSHYLSNIATETIETCREKVKQFINAKNAKEIIWTKGTTDSINIVASGMDTVVNPGDDIVLSVAEHHANIVPWQQLAKRTGAKLIVLPIDDDKHLDMTAASTLITSKTKLLVVTHKSNVLGSEFPVKQLCSMAKLQGAITLVDGAQKVSSGSVDVQDIDCDFYVFSGHKMYGPTGVGVLYGKYHRLEELPVYQTGGEMIEHVSFDETRFNAPPSKFETGTPNIAGIVGFSYALDFVQQLDFDTINQHLTDINSCVDDYLSNLPQLTRVSQKSAQNNLLTFDLSGENKDLGDYLDMQGVAVRVGRHCAMPLYESLKLSSALRLSFACYNTLDEVDATLKHINSFIRLVDGVRSSNAPEMSVIDIEQASGWDSKLSALIRFGGALEPMPQALKNDANLVQGCESKVWLFVEKEVDGDKVFADSDSKLVRGLLAIVLSHVKKDPISGANSLTEHLAKVGLERYLSPSRNNGIKQVIQLLQSSLAR